MAHAKGRAVLEAGLGKTILVVDDDPVMLQNYEAILKAEGYIVITRQDGRSALIDIFEILRPDLIITDYRMPGMDGLEFVAHVKKIAPEIPVILCSFHMRSDVYAKGFNLGIANCLTKPFTPHELHLAVEMALKTSVARSIKNS